MTPAVRFLTQGESGLVVELGAAIDETLNRRVHRLTRLLEALSIPAVREIVPTYRSLLVIFDPIELPRTELVERVRSLLPSLRDVDPGTAGSAPVVIPVCYGGDFGPDLEFVASHCGLPAEEVVQLHSSVDYLVYMLGFTPGFPYLGGMPPRIAAPRLETPRTLIPAGSVGIAGGQTGIYPVASPGGWRLIGRTPLKIFDPSSDAPFRFSPGDGIRFVPISAGEYRDIEEREKRQPLGKAAEAGTARRTGPC